MKTFLLIILSALTTLKIWGVFLILLLIALLWVIWYGRSVKEKEKYPNVGNWHWWNGQI